MCSFKAELTLLFNLQFLIIIEFTRRAPQHGPTTRSQHPGIDLLLSLAAVSSYFVLRGLSYFESYSVTYSFVKKSSVAELDLAVGCCSSSNAVDADRAVATSQLLLVAVCCNEEVSPVTRGREY